MLTARQGTELANAQIDTLRIRLYFASNWPSAPIFAQALRELRSP